MTKKIIIGMILLAGIVFFSTGSVFASDDEKPWASMTRFRGEDSLSAQEVEMSRDDFHAYRDETREVHRQSRLKERAERLEEAVKSGCITEDEMIERMQTRRGRFSK